MSTESEGRSSPSTIGLPDSLRQAVGRFYNLPLGLKAALETLINDYVDDILYAAAKRRGLDVNLSDCIARCCSTLLNEEWHKAEDLGKRFIQGPATISSRAMTPG